LDTPIPDPARGTVYVQISPVAVGEEKDERGLPVITSPALIVIGPGMGNQIR